MKLYNPLARVRPRPKLQRECKALVRYMPHQSPSSPLSTRPDNYLKDAFTQVSQALHDVFCAMSAAGG